MSHYGTTIFLDEKLEHFEDALLRGNFVITSSIIKLLRDIGFEAEADNLQAQEMQAMDKELAQSIQHLQDSNTHGEMNYGR